MCQSETEETKPEKTTPIPTASKKAPNQNGDKSQISQTAEQTTPRFLCTICVDTPVSEHDHASLPSCGHTFCLPCVISWSFVQTVCPNCKTCFQSVYARRGEDGRPIQGPTLADGTVPRCEHAVQALQEADWLDVTAIHSAQHDIEASFSLALRDGIRDATAPVGEGSSTPFANEEAEDELEHRIWEEEAAEHETLLRTTRTISNRRFGLAGYISAGRRQATPRPAAAGSAAPSAPGGKPRAGAGSMRDGAHATSRRKKKLKKKSRAGIAAAREAELRAEECARAAASTSASASASASASDAVGSEGV